MTGRYENVNSVLLLGGGAVYFAHRYGIDKKIVEKTKKKYNDLRNRFRKDGVQKITII
jgi:hypothetical protein